MNARITGYFMINDFVVNKKLNKKSIELFEISIKRVAQLAYSFSQERPGGVLADRIFSYTDAFTSGIQILGGLHGEVKQWR